MKVFIDSSAFLAIVDSDDTCHTQVVPIFHEILTYGAQLFTSNFILDETYTLIRTRTDHRNSVKFLKNFESSGIIVLEVSREIETAAKNIFIRYKDKDFSFTDCTSFALIDAHKIDAVLAFDKHFKHYPYKRTVTYLVDKPSFDTTNF